MTWPPARPTGDELFDRALRDRSGDTESSGTIRPAAVGTGGHPTITDWCGFLTELLQDHGDATRVSQGDFGG